MKKDIDSLKEEYINKTFELLTIKDIYKDDRIGIACRCACACGNQFTAALRKIVSGHVKSCGCYRKSKDFRDKMSSINSSDDKKKMISDRVKEWYKNNPDKVAEKAMKFSQWCKNNPDKVAESNNRVSEWAKNNPDKVAARVKKFKQWCEENPEKLKEIGAKKSQWCKDNPEKVAKRGKNYSEWRKNNPDKCDEIGKKISLWYKDNPDKVKSRTDNAQATYKKNHSKNIATLKEYYSARRIDAVKDLDLSFVHEDDLEQILSGESSHALVRVRCPVCGEYDYHKIYYFIDYTNRVVKCQPRCHRCAKINHTSSCEQEIAEFISTFYSGECIRNSRDVISPLELDLYYPYKNIAIEYNGAYFHSEQNDTARDYHFNKFKLCRERGIRLISIFEQDWLLKRDKIEMILRDTFSESIKIYARKCIAKRLSYQEKSEFINKYHFDGDSHQGNIAYGLFYRDELVSVMSFGKLRGQNSLSSKDSYYELVRFVTKSNYHITGGASKLFNIFIREFSPKYVLCYSDNDFFTGVTYERLGFKLKSLGEKSLDYQWYDKTDCLSRYSCMTSRLLQKYPQYKEMNIIGSKEKFIMEDLGYYRIYRCGNSIWEYTIE